MSAKKHKEIRKQNKALRRDEEEIAIEAVKKFMYKTLNSPFRVRCKIALKIIGGLSRGK